MHENTQNNLLSSDDCYLSAKTIKKMYDISNSTFYDLRKKGKIPMPHYPFGKNLPRYLKSEVINLIEKEK